MFKLLLRFALLVMLGLGFAWLADRPGDVTIHWMGREVQTSVLVAAVLMLLALALLLFFMGLLRRIWRSPRATRDYFRFRKTRKGYESLSRGIIAAGAGDAHGANRHANAAALALGDEPLVALLAAQAAQLKGDRPKVRAVFEQMTKSSDTEVLGLRGLFAEARAGGDLAGALQHAERAMSLNPRLPWASSAVLQVQIARQNWEAAAQTLEQQGKSGSVTKAEADTKRAALLAAQALKIEDSDQAQAFALAAKAHDLDPALVPATLVMARSHIASGNARKAKKLLRKGWELFAHPDIAELMGNIEPGANAESRFERVRDSVGDTGTSLEAAVALSKAAVAAMRYDVARQTLEPYCNSLPQTRVCVLMAQVEEAAGDKGRSREWLARAIHATRDPMWVSDGVANTKWVPVSPVTGEIVPCQWKVPFDVAIPAGTSTETALAGTKAVALPPAVQNDATNDAPLQPRADDPGVES